jgi:formylglycine-generating enzyme required for sulfatase activity
MSQSTLLGRGLRGLLLAVAGCLCSLAVASDAEENADVDLTLVPGGEEFTNSLGMRFVRVKAGKFLMGAPDEEKDAEADEKPRHEVTITKDYYLAVHEVTQRQYKDVMGTNPSECSATGSNKELVRGISTDDFPVEMVTWNDTQDFLKKLNALPAEAASRFRYRLPSEAEWEFACRGGSASTKLFHFAEPTDKPSFDQANFDGRNPYGGGEKGKSPGRPARVGSYKPNKLGLYDVHGNVWEWCDDRYDEKYYAKSPLRDPAGPAAGERRVFRGGSYLDGGERLRAANRAGTEATFRSGVIGFRVAASLR